MTNVSRLTSEGRLVVDGKPACVKCGRRPQRWSGKRWQSYCSECHSYDQWQRRAGKTEVLVRQEDRGLVLAIRRAELSAEEREVVIGAIVEMRAKPAGRHHAAGLYRKAPAMKKIIMTLAVAAALVASSAPAALAATNDHSHGRPHHHIVCSEPFLTVNRWTGTVVSGTGVACLRD